MGPGNYLVLVEDDSSFTSRFPDVKNYLGETGFGLSGSGEFMKLVNNEGEIIDSLTYDDKSPWPEEADGNGSTLELVDAGKDNSIAENWNASQGHGTPGKVNSVVTSVEKMSKAAVPKEFLLFQNFPNPFNPLTSIGFSLPFSCKVSVTVYNQLGQQVASIADRVYSAGTYWLNFNANNLASGVYFYRIKAGLYFQTKKMILMK